MMDLLKSNIDLQSTIRVALFCGGRGSASIIQELLRWPTVQLTLIVNAYDDGLSTGALRNYISEMLGPSDFRKNLSYLLNPFSEGQYALKNLLEFRLPATFGEQHISNFSQFVKTGDCQFLFEPLKNFFTELSPQLFDKIHRLLSVFFNYASSVEEPFNFSDCSVGNLIFAGAYLEQNKSFNAAANELSNLTSSRARLVNVSEGENRILVGLKENGEILACEAQIVGAQSTSPIRNLFLLKHPLEESTLSHLATLSMEEKETWLLHQEDLPNLSQEAELAINSADIILYGPGTQHSSLFPSYRIAQAAIKKALTQLKVFIMNLEPDHDIQQCTADQVIHQALYYLKDPENQFSISHILLDKKMLLPEGELNNQLSYCNALIIRDNFVNDYKKKIHNGRTVVEKILTIKENQIHNSNLPELDLFMDINTRSLAVESLLDEFFEIDWKDYFSHTTLTINQPQERDIITEKVKVTLKPYSSTDSFPEIPYFIDWLKHGTSEYLVLLTGDGEYRFRDVMLAIHLLKESHFGAIFGSRTQSRMQFRTALHAAYSEKKLLSWFSFFGAFIMSALYAFRFGVIFSDPLTGFRIFSRSRISHLTQTLQQSSPSTPTKITTFFIRHCVEIAEIPVTYKTFSGFTDPHWRVRRGIKNLLSIFRRS